MRHRLLWALPAAVLIAASAAPVAAMPATTPKARPQAQAETAKLATQHAEVDRLRHAVAAQESGNQDAARQLRQRDARIAELQRQLRAVSQGPATTAGGH